MNTVKLRLIGGGLLLAYAIGINLLKPSGETLYTSLGIVLSGLVLLITLTLPTAKRPQLAPVLASMVPVLFLWASNPGQANARIALLTLLTAMLAVALLHLLLYALIRNPLKATLITTVCIILFFTYGHAFNILWDIKIVWTKKKLYLLLSAGYTGLFLVTLIGLLRSRRNLEQLALLAVTVPAIMIGFSAFQLSTHATATENKADEQVTNNAFTDPTTGLPAPGEPTPNSGVDQPGLPDIYYIIPDAYARHDIIAEVFNHDNQPFIDWLEGKGFYVAKKSTSNYSMTFLSLASSLNAVYLDQVIEKAGRQGTSRSYITQLTRNHWTGRYLRNKGYRYGQIMTMAGATSHSDIVDLPFEYVPYWRRNQFNTVFTQTTMLRATVPSVSGSHKFSFESIEGLADKPGPDFLLAHMIIPHPPYVYDREGNVQDDVALSLHWDQAEHDKLGNGYLDMVVYFNQRIQLTIERILERSAQTPIIIIQADHGWINSGKPDADPSEREKWAVAMHERHSILNAYLVPPEVRARLYETITPVNTFRVVLSELFNEDIPLLPDENYFTYSEATPYDVIPATDILQKMREAE